MTPLDLQSKLVIGAIAAGIADVVAQADAVGGAVVLAEVANLAVARIGNDRLRRGRVHADDIDRAGEHAQAAAGTGLEIDGELAAGGIAGCGGLGLGHGCTSVSCSPRMMAPIGPSATASGVSCVNRTHSVGNACRSNTTLPSLLSVAPCQQN